jgi:hypothetical protein
MRRLAVASAVLLVGCATTGGVVQAAEDLEARAARCERFTSFEGELRAVSDQLLASAPGERVLQGSELVSRARRACAQATLLGLLERRESAGVVAAQLELDAMARALPPGELRRLSREVLGAGVPALEAMLAEALAHVGPTSLRPQQAAFVDTPLTCRDQTEPCARVWCLTGESGASGNELEGAARACLDGLRAQPAEVAAPQLSKLVVELGARGATGALTEGLVQLETLRRALWPRIEAALPTQPARAARLAEPFTAIAGARGEVARVRAVAVRAHLELATAAGARVGVARLHRLVAADLGGPSEPALEAVPGRWGTGRWGCTWEQPQLPAPFPGAELRLEAACRQQQREAARGPTGELATFELERDLVRETVDGWLRASCGGRTYGFALSLRNQVYDGVAGRADALRAELEHLVGSARRTCERAREAQVQADCEGVLTGAAAEQRFVEHFEVLGRWPLCFARAFEERYGVAPPPRL